QFGQLGSRQPQAGEREIAPVGHRVPQLGGDPSWLIVVPDVVQDREQQQADGLLEVDQLAHIGIGQDLGGLADVPYHDVGGPRVGEQRLAVGVDDRVVVDLHDVHRRVVGVC